MHPAQSKGKAIIWLLLAVASSQATSVNIAPDALTHATEGYHTYVGELAYLTDGRYPGHGEQPGVFAWPSVGNLVFQLTEPRRVSGMRLYVGRDAGYYEVAAFRGARFGANGQTDSWGAEMVAVAANSDLQTDAWILLPFPPGTLADYLELSTDDSAEFYEIEVLADAPQPTAVSASSWAGVKTTPR